MNKKIILIICCIIIQTLSQHHYISSNDFRIKNNISIINDGKMRYFIWSENNELFSGLIYDTYFI